MTEGIGSQTWDADYPLIAYNSVYPDNSRLVFANLAEREHKLSNLSLGDWKFVSFVKKTCLPKFMVQLSKFNCQVAFIARHRKFLKNKIMLLDMDPWSVDAKPSLLILNSSEFQLPPVALTSLKSVHLISN